MYLPTSSARMMLVSLEGWVERAWRTALREQPLLLSSSTAWMLATSGLVEDLEDYDQKNKFISSSAVAIEFFIYCSSNVYIVFRTERFEMKKHFHNRFGDAALL